MKEAKDHSRVSPEGQRVGEKLSRLTEHEIKKLVADGEPDDRCKTCAFRKGTVPNGCIQTMADAMKAVMEDVPFMCHQSKECSMICHGWYAARRALKGKTAVMPWDFSPPDAK